MKKIVGVLGAVVGLLVLGCICMALLQICPPHGPWPIPPWCPGSQYPWPFSSSEAPDMSPLAGGEIDREVLPPEVKVAAVAVEVVSNMGDIQSYYQEAVVGMARTSPSLPGSIGLHEIPGCSGGRLASVRLIYFNQQYEIPEGFMQPLDSSGYIPAPAGACAAGAAPMVRFNIGDNEPITSAYLEEMAVQSIDFARLTGGDPNVDSLEEIIDNALTPGDIRLTTPEGWNEVLWGQLQSLQTPLESLMDYHLWSCSEQYEGMVVEAIEERLDALGLPEVILDAFEKSNRFGWFSSRASEEGDRLSSMAIVAEFSGDLSGTIEEWREFSIPTPGEMPVFGPMSGSGRVEFEHPTLGILTFDVELKWTEWDELGRVISGTMDMVDEAHGYEIHMRFNPDGTKEGDIVVDGVLVGKVSMDVVGTSTYIDIEEGLSYPTE